MGRRMRAGLAILALHLAFPGIAHAVAPSIAAGSDRSCAINSSGGALCWGDNSFGALGSGAATQSAIPVSVVGLSSGVKSIATGSFHACAVTGAGAVVCWGHNSQAQLGNGTADVESSVPAPVTGLSSGVKAIAAGDSHTCALTDAGAVWCWGDGYDGQLGNGSRGLGLTPAPVTGLSSGIVAIAAGGFHTCAVTSAGAMLCWGSNDYGQLGNGTTAQSDTPIPVTGLSSSVAAIATGYRHTCALTSAGAVACWGDNDSGQLGNGTTIRVFVPVPVPGLLSGVTALAAGSYHTCAVNNSGGALCWGYNQYGQLGNGSTSDRSTPVPVTGLSSGVKAIATGLGYDFACALTIAGAVRCWGHNSNGQLGNGTTASSLVPTQVTGLASGVTAIATGASFGCALAASGGVTCWGDNSSFELGNGRAIGFSSPIPVIGLSSGAAAISTNIYHSCAVTTAGAARCWGYNVLGQLGDGTTNNSSVPVSVTGLPSALTAIGAGYFFTCALTSAGGVLCWGDNVIGQLGNGTTNGSPAPTAVSGLSSGVQAISVHTYHTCALTTEGAVQCWGDNGSGQLGDGTTINRSDPVPAATLSSGVVAIAAGGYHTCALTTSGGVLCWGYNAYGQLGNGTTTDSLVPTAVTGLSSGVSAISAGDEHTCALTNAGAVLCWGDNQSGQLGSGTTTNSPVPVPVAGLSSGVATIAAGGFHTCALSSAGDVLCWGFNSSGGLGDGTFANRTKSVVVVREGAAGNLATNDWFLDLKPGAPITIPADKIPSYLVNTSGNATTAIVDVTASVRFRSQDAGLPIYVFGYAPASLVKRAVTGKDGPTCVLVQLSPSGQLQQASASNLSLAGNVLSSQQQSVSVLNSVPATNVGGSTLCVGTAATSAQSVDPANSRCVATVPATVSGNPVCLAPELSSSAPVANVPGALSGLWWNSNESGWGINFTQRSNIVFAAWYTYDAAGNPKWYVAPHCQLPSAASNGSCTETLYEVNGPTFFGTAFNPAATRVAAAGSLQVSFTNANTGAMTYTVSGQTRTVAIARQPFPQGTTPPPVDYTDLWWNPGESGWGMAITHQFNVAFLAWYVYDAAGKPVWYVSTCTMNSAQTGCSGSLLRTTGPAFGPTFNPSQVQVFTAGSVTLGFTDPNNATLGYTLGDVTATKTITRQLF